MNYGVRCLFLLVCSVVVCYASTLNPEVICMTFDEGCEPGDEITSPLFETVENSDADNPYVYCLDSVHPEDIRCDVHMLIKSDMFAETMQIKSVSIDFPDPSNDTASCSLSFLSGKDREWTAPEFHEAQCGVIRENFDISEKDVADSDLEELFSHFQMANVTEMIITSYIPVFGCRYRIKRVQDAKGIIPAANVTGGSAFELDSFFCTIGFGITEGRLPETKYPAQMYYKRVGKRWRPVDVWPHYHRK